MARASSDPVHVRVTCTSPMHTCPDECSNIAVRFMVLDDDKEQDDAFIAIIY